VKRYSIFIKGPAEKEMDTLPKGVFFRAQKSILGLEINPRPRACKEEVAEQYGAEAGIKKKISSSKKRN